MDIDTLMQIKKEEVGYQDWLKEKKNQILAMTNTEKKQVQWSKMIGHTTPSDDNYLLGEIF